MSRSPLISHRSLLYCLLVALYSLTAVADDKKAKADDVADSFIPGVAQSLRYAWESFEEYFEIASAHGERAAMAWNKIQLDDWRSRLSHEIEQQDTVVRSWTPYRYHWTGQQESYFQELQGRKQQLHDLDLELRTLDQRWRMLDEVARIQAQDKGKAAIPLDRAGLLREFQRLGDKKLRAYTGAKLAIGEAAAESKQTPKAILDKAVRHIRSRTANVQTLKPFIAEFKVFYGPSPKPSHKPPRRVGKTSGADAKKRPAGPLELD